MKIVSQLGTFKGKFSQLVTDGIITSKKPTDFKIGEHVLVTRKFTDFSFDEVQRGEYVVTSVPEWNKTLITIEGKHFDSYLVEEKDLVFVEKIEVENESTKKKDLVVYNAGHILNDAMVAYREKQHHEIDAINGIKAYSPHQDKSINDKSNAVQEGLAERILKNDFKAMQEADVFVFDILNEGLGTIAELGIVLGMKHQAKKELDAFIDKCIEDDVIFVDQLANNKSAAEAYKTFFKPVLCYCSDIRQGHGKPYTDPDRAEYSTNQFVYGCVLNLTEGKGFISWEEVKEELASLGEAAQMFK